MLRPGARRRSLWRYHMAKRPLLHSPISGELQFSASHVREAQRWRVRRIRIGQPQSNGRQLNAICFNAVIHA